MKQSRSGRSAVETLEPRRLLSAAYVVARDFGVVTDTDDGNWRGIAIGHNGEIFYHHMLYRDDAAINMSDVIPPWVDVKDISADGTMLLSNGSLLKDGVITEISVPGAASDVFSAMNAGGMVAGYYSIGDDTHFFRYTNGSFEPLPNLGGDIVDISDNGIILIQRGDRSYYYDRGDLWSIAYDDDVSVVSAHSINASGTIVGGLVYRLPNGYGSVSFPDDYGIAGFVAGDQVVIRLEGVSELLGINDAGTYVGREIVGNGPNYQALADVTEGLGVWKNIEALGIDDIGNIFARARSRVTGQLHLLKLVPTEHGPSSDVHSMRGSIDTTSLGSVITPGQTGRVKLSVDNTGSTRAQTRAKVSLYLSDDEVISDDDPIIGEKMIKFDLRAGKTSRFNVGISIPATTGTGEHGVLARLTPISGNAAAVSDETFAALSTVHVHHSFGDVGDRKNVTLPWMGEDGTGITYRLTGGGTGTLLLDEEGQLDLSVTGTSRNSKLIITTSAMSAATLDDVTISDLNGVFASRVKVTGNVTLGACKTLRLGDVTDSLLEVNQTSSISIRLKRVVNSGLEVSGAVRSLVVDSWTNENYSPRVWSEMGFDHITSRGAFSVKLETAGAVKDAFFAHDLRDSRWEAAKGIGDVVIRGNFADSQFLGSSEASVRSLVVTGFIQNAIIACGYRADSGEFVRAGSLGRLRAIEGLDAQTCIVAVKTIRHRIRAGNVVIDPTTLDRDPGTDVYTAV